MCDNEVIVKKEVRKKLESYYLLRGIKQDSSKKIVTNETKFYRRPTDEEIAIFIFETGVDFASVEKNYRLLDIDLPF